MRKCIILFAMSIFLIFLSSCQKENLHEHIEFGEWGSLIFNSGFLELSQAGKYEVPNCSQETPIKVIYLMIAEDGTEFSKEAAVSVEQKRIISTEDVDLKAGDYMVLDVALFSANGTLTHRIPSREGDGFDFSSFVDVSTPFEIEVFPEQTTGINGQVICYTSQILDLSDGNLSTDLEMLDLQTLYFEMPTKGSFFEREKCMDSVSIVTDGKVIYSQPTNRFGIYGTPIIKNFDAMIITAFMEGEAMELWLYVNSSYNIDEQGNHEDEIDYSDVVQFNNACD